MNIKENNTEKKMNQSNKQIMKDLEVIISLMDGQLNDTLQCIKKNKHEMLPLMLRRLEHSMAALKDNTALRTPIKYPDGTPLLSIKDIEYQ